MASQTYNSLHILALDGSEEQVVNGMYKDMTIDRFKRTIALMNNAVVRNWEDIHLFYMGTELENRRTLQSYDIQNGAIIRFVLSESNEKRRPIPINPLPNDSKILPTYDESTVEGKILRTVFALNVDTNQSHNVGPVPLGMPVTQFINKVAGIQGIEPQHLRIIYNGKQFKEGMTLKDYNLQDESTVHCVLRVVGGDASGLL